MLRTVKLLVLVAIIAGLINIRHILADDRVSNLQSVTLEDFELDQNGKPKRIWTAVPDRFGREGNSDAGKSLQSLAWIESWPEAYFGKEGVFDDGNEKRSYKTCLALKPLFNRKGYNRVELYPMAEVDGKLVRKPIDFKGRVKQIDLWIWGANYDYYMEMVLMDYRGVEHRLPIGSIMHVGWKNFVVVIPVYIPQNVATIPSLKQFSLVKLELWTNPGAQIIGSYVYIDHIKYLSDIMESKFDGYNLGDIQTTKNLWDKAPKAPEPDQQNTATNTTTK